MCADHGLFFHPAQFEQATSALHSTRIWDALHAAIAETDMRMAENPLYEDRPTHGNNLERAPCFAIKNPQPKILRYRIYTIGTQVIVTLADRSLKRFLLDIKFLNAQS